MTNEMIAVQANIDMTKELLKTEKNRLIAKLEDIVNKFIVNPHGAMITQRDIRIGLWSETEIHFNIGFYNEAEKRVDFASDAWFEYNTKKNELLVNYGTIGNYTKSNIYHAHSLTIWRHCKFTVCSAKRFCPKRQRIFLITGTISACPTAVSSLREMITGK